MNRHRLTSLLCTLAAAAGLAVVWPLPHEAVASPPGAPTGVIYYTDGTGLLWFMNPDGTGKTALPAGVSGEPSRIMHGGARWFLKVVDMGGTYPNTTEPRREVFAMREDGYGVQLTNHASRQPTGSVRWTTSPSDGGISWVAREFDAGGAVIASGIYTAQILYDVSGEILGLVSQPAIPLFAASDVASHDWSPAGTSVVYALGSGSSGVYAVDNVGLPTQTTRTLSTSGHEPAWSPTGTKIAFHAAAGVITINPDGSGRTTLIASGPTTTVARASWSPGATHLTYLWADNLDIASKDVYVAKSDGKGKTNLTPEIGGQVSPVAWREGTGTGAGYCGDGVLNPGETPCTCPQDAGAPATSETNCSDGIDNDCDGYIDCDDADCDCASQICAGGDANWATAEGGCKDLQTGLVWSLPGPCCVNWNTATQYAADLVEGGYSDWRLPTRAELETAASHLAYPQLLGSGECWSSTTQGGTRAYTVNLQTGVATLRLKSSSLSFHCVRQGTP